jgi:hypothetical protein
MKYVVLRTRVLPYVDTIITWFNQTYNIKISRVDAVHFAVNTMGSLHINDVHNFLDTNKIPRLPGTPYVVVKVNKECSDKIEELYKRYCYKVGLVRKYAFLAALIKERAVSLPSIQPFKTRLTYLFATAQPKTMIDLAKNVADKYNKNIICHRNLIS